MFATSTANCVLNLNIWSFNSSFCFRISL